MILYSNSAKLGVKIFCCRVFYEFAKPVALSWLLNPFTNGPWFIFKNVDHTFLCLHEQVNVN